MAESAAETALDLLVFEVAGVRLGIALSAVREVVRAVFITPLPDAPPAVEGVIDVRGGLVPVYDLRLRFGLPPRRLHPEERLVLAWTGERMVAARCDAVAGTVSVPQSAIEAGDVVHAGTGSIRGVARLDDGLVLVHDLAAFLDDAERVTLANALAAHAERADG